MGMLGTVALHLVQDLEEDRQNGVTARLRVSLAVDVEEDHIGLRGHGALDVAQQHGILDLGLKELDGLPDLAVVRVRAILEQVGEDFDEVRLPGAKEP
jgi:hypothetical protein